MDIRDSIKERILLLDGAMGTMVQGYNLKEEDYRGTQFSDHPCDLKGNNDILSLTKPEVIEDIHFKYLSAGADIIETNTLNATGISQSDYQLEGTIYEMNLAAAKIARKAVDRYLKAQPERSLFVAGAIGPTNKTASISPDINDPKFRAVTFDDLVETYTEQVRGLVDGGVDLLLVETIFDTLNCKAALFAINQFQEINRLDLPVMASFTISDSSGRTLSGQTVEGFWNAISNAGLFCVGLNCALGAEEMRPHIEELSSIADCYVHAYPNAGLPDEFGEYVATPDTMKGPMKDFAESGFVNIIGGCCGTTPEHISKFGKEIENIPPRKIPGIEPYTRLSGLEAMTIRPDSNFINVGERTNVSGSKKFARLIKDELYEEALSVAKDQVDNGAQIIDVNMDDAMLDSAMAMTDFLNMIATEPDIAKVPVMVDSSKWSVIEAGLKCLQGKGVVNSISLKEGEDIFREQAKKIRRYGAAVIVMAFDEKGQAETEERKVEICKRSYSILHEEMGFPPQDIIFDPNVFAVGTGIEEHNTYTVAYFNATKQLKKLMPLAKISGGVSNVSFAFRGNNVIREAMHSAFLYHAIKAGMDMGIVNAGLIEVYEEIPKELLQLVEDLLLNRNNEATERLTQFVSEASTKERKTKDDAWRKDGLEDRICYGLIKGIDEYLEEDINEALKAYDDPVKIIEEPLMNGMSTVGGLFKEGKMFLPQVVKSARVMKKAVAIITPVIEEGGVGEKGKDAATILLATVKGDVHDIGKNIVQVILSCNNYKVIDAGVMVPAEKILDIAEKEKADVIGLSGLITPSLEEMAHVAREMERRKFNIPLLIGGATTSRVHTAVKLEPFYNGSTVYIPDASKSVPVVGELLNSQTGNDYIRKIKEEYNDLRKTHSGKKEKRFLPIEEARKKKVKLTFNDQTITEPTSIGTKVFKDYDLKEIAEYIDWTPLFSAWELKGKYPEIFDDKKIGEEARKVFDDAQKMLKLIIDKNWLSANGVVGIFPANSIEDDIEVYKDEDREEVLTVFHTLRQQYYKGEGRESAAMADFIAPKESGINDYIGGFAVSTGFGIEERVRSFEEANDDYSGIMLKLLADRLAEAFAELMHEKVRREVWGYEDGKIINKNDLLANSYLGIRPAPGYPGCPDHSEKINLFKALCVEENVSIELTESFAMYPAAAVCGYYFAHPESRYFGLGKINIDQVEDYAKRKNKEMDVIQTWLSTNLNYKPL